MKLKIGFEDFEVVPLSNQDSIDEGIDGQIRWGGSRPPVIRIRADARPRRQAEILIHELLHAALDMAGKSGTALEEEDICSSLDGPLTTLIRDNPPLLAVLMQAIHNDTPVVSQEAA